MARGSDRLQRYLENELEECRIEDVDRRLTELSTLETALDAVERATHLEVLSALANETRYTIVRVLVEADEELCVCELDPFVDVSESGRSHALSELVDAGLVEGRTDGRWRKYRATNRAVALLTVLDGSVTDE
ncbi:MAG: ArsR/SmtB family transcription factor [Halobacteriota archaeon]